MYLSCLPTNIVVTLSFQQEKTMIVFFDHDFYPVYTGDPAAEEGRMEAIVEEIASFAVIEPCIHATREQLLTAHTRDHIEYVEEEGLYPIASLAAGGAIQAAEAGMQAPSFALIRPPGHHASRGSCWGFCYFNNMAISLYALKRKKLIETAFVLDFDLHYGDGNVNILGNEEWVELLNPEYPERTRYLDEVRKALEGTPADVIAVSAGFDNHVEDWGNVLQTVDYETMGRWVRRAAQRNGGGCYGILEGGYNHQVLGRNVLAFLTGLDG